ncbi:MAG: amino acid ABC transporter substrate-binding protein [Caldilineales bacterium]
MRSKFFSLLALVVVFSMLLSACSQAATPAPAAPAAEAAPTAAPAAEAPASQKILDAVKARGKLVCGIHTSLPGFGYLDADGKNRGFDIDVCRAVAAAVFGNADAVEFVPISAAERGPALQTREVDLVSRNMTWTSSREAQWGNFTQVMFYDGQGILVRTEGGFTTLEDLDGATICVTTGTTTEQNLADAFRERGLTFTAVTFEDTNAVYSAYEDGRCDAATSDKSQLAAVRSGFANPADHLLLDETLSKEPLTPAVPAGDDQWHDLVSTVLGVLINAEELGVTSANVQEMKTSENVVIQRMLGSEGSFGQADLGLSNDFAVNVIASVGNYGEIYDRYMGPNGLSFTLDRGLNNLWSNGGLIYGIPLR